MITILIPARSNVKVAVVVPAHDNFLWMRELLQPIYSLLNLLDTAIVAQIPRVDKQVAVRNVGILLGMGVGDAHDANRPDARRW